MTNENRDEFSTSTKRLLAERVGFCCSFPTCPQITIGPSIENENATASIGQACHIYAAAPGGKRYNSSMTSAQRSAPPNGIWMCYTHGKLIDTSDQYSAETLKQWKQDAETRALQKLESGVAAMSFIQWRFYVNDYLQKTLANPSASRTRLGQYINIENNPDFYVPRQQLNKVLNHWWETVSTSRRGLAILGPEGHGKTWGIAHWVHQLLDQEEPPAVLFFGSINDIPFEPESMILEYCRNCKDRLDWPNWFREKEPQHPTILVIFDGINENPNFPWRRVFSSLQLEAWPQRIAWIANCRPPAWHQHTDGELKVQTFELAGYDDSELAIALAAHNLNKEDLPPFVIESDLIRIPRMFDLVLKYRKTLEESGDITKERLIYEEFKDLLGRKDPYKMGFNDDDYKVYLKKLAEKMMPTYRDLVEKELPRPFFKDDTAQKVIEELISRGVMTQTNGKYKVNKDRMMLGIGLLLIDHLMDPASEHPTLSIYQFFDPLNDIDLKRDIVGFAAYHSLVDRSICSKIRMALFSVWMEARNWDADLANAFCAYFPINPEFYFDFFEAACKGDIRTSLKHSWLARFVLIAHKDVANKLTLYIQKFEKWCGYVDSTGSYGFIGREDKLYVSYRQKLGKLLGLTNLTGSVQVDDYSLYLTESPDDLVLAEIALEVISHMDRASFSRCLVITALAECLMFRPTRVQTLRWVIRAADCDLEPELMPDIGNLLKLDHPFAACAASMLMTALGNESSYADYELLPKASLNPFEWPEQKPSDDPCNTLYRWSDAECSICSGRTDLSVEYICRKLGGRCFNPKLIIPTQTIQRLGAAIEELDMTELFTCRQMTSARLSLDTMMPLIASCAPELYRSLLERVMICAIGHEGESLIAWALSLSDHALLINERFRDVLTTKWRHALESIIKDDGTNGDMKYVEYQLLTRLLSLTLNGSEQLTMLIERPKNALPLSVHHVACLNPIANSLILELFKTYTLPHQLEIILHFCCANPTVMSLSILQTIFKMTIDHPNLSEYGFSILRQCENLEATKSLVVNALTSSDGEPNWQSWEGSCLLVQHASALATNEVIRRIDPRYYGLVVVIRQQHEDLMFFVAHLERLIEDGFPQHSSIHYNGGLLEAFKAQPNLIDRCIEKLKQNPTLASSFLLNHPFFIQKVFEFDTNRGISLFQTLSNNRSNFITFEPNIIFSVKSSDQLLNQLRSSLLKQATLDFQLLQYATEAQKAGHQEYMWQELSLLLASSVPFERARGVTMLGFFHDHKGAKKTLLKLIMGPKCWIRGVAERAYEKYQKNLWTRHWFKQFVRGKSMEDAWAGFTMFLAVVDSRFMIWNDPFLEELSQNKHRRSFFLESEQAIYTSIKENEKPLNETLFGDKITKDKLSLWRKDIYQLPRY